MGMAANMAGSAVNHGVLTVMDCNIAARIELPAFGLWKTATVLGARRGRVTLR